MPYTPVQIFKRVKGAEPEEEAWIPCAPSRLDLVAVGLLEMCSHFGDDELNQSIAERRSGGRGNAAIWDDRAELVFCSRE